MASNSATGNYLISWYHSRTAGSTYILEEQKDGGAWNQIASQTGNIYNVSGRTTGSYLYRVKATLGGYADSTWKQGTAVTVP